MIAKQLRARFHLSNEIVVSLDLVVSCTAKINISKSSDIFSNCDR
jgi:hypothetical protein